VLTAHSNAAGNTYPSPSITQITATTTITITSSPDTLTMLTRPQSILFPSANNSGSSSAASSHISFAEQLDRLQAATRMSQIVPQQNLRTMAELDKEEEIRLANVHRRRKPAANRLTQWWGKKLGK
jgi:hypothetical protein